MYRGKKIGLVVPAYNEEKLVVPTLSAVPKLVDRIYVVNDASTDNTKKVVLGLKKRDGRIVLIDHGKNMGVARAIITGYLRSYEDNNFATVMVTGDNQMDISEVTNFLDPLIMNQADFVKGNRFLYSKKIRREMPLIRVIGNVGLSFLTKFASGYWKIFDSNNGFFVIRNSFIHKVDWENSPDGYGFNGDWLTRFNFLDMRVKDIPSRPIYLKNEKQSKINVPKYFVTVLPRLLRLFLWRLWEKYLFRNFHPLVLFYFLAILLIPLGLLVGIHIIYNKIAFGVITGSTSVLATLLLTLGFQSLSFAILFDMEDNKDLCV